MRWMAGIFKKLVASVVWQIILFLVKQQFWWPVVVAAASLGWAWIVGLFPWYMWVVVLVGSFSLFMAIRQTWFPDGFRKKTIDEFLTDHQDKIRDAIQENVGVVLLRKIQYLYPKLQEWGIQMPEIRPFVDTNRGRNFHIGLLKDLDFQITKLKDGVPFDLKRWGETVSLRENARDVLVKEEKAGGLLNELELQMLTFIVSKIGKSPVTTSAIYTHEPFLKISPASFLRLSFTFEQMNTSLQRKTLKITHRHLNLLNGSRFKRSQKRA